MHKRLIGASVLAFLWAATASGQSIPNEPDSARTRLRLGPLWLNPTISVGNAGVETNVFNEPDSDDPKSDFAIAFTPATDLWLRMGRTWLTGSLREDFVYYRTYSGERSANNNYVLGWLVPLNRVSFITNGNWIDTRDRPGFEIDARAKRQERAVNGAAEVRVLSRTLFGARGERRKIEFEEGARFLDADLRVELSRTQTTGAVTVRHELTPLTSFTLDVSRQEERFEFSPQRDSDSTHVSLGLRFDPVALVSGTAQVGYRDFKPLTSDLAGYRGTTALVSLSYVALGSTKLTVQGNRDIQHSFEAAQPYYLETGFSGSLAQQIYGPVDAEVRLGHHRLAYRNREGASLETSTRVDKVQSYGFGVGYRLSRDFRVGFNSDHQDRTSDLARRAYDGSRYGMTLTYGL